MNTDEQQAILDSLDLERQTVLYPGVTRHRDGEVVWDVSAARFHRIEQHAAETGRAVSGLSLEEMEAVWQAAKGEEK